MRLILVAEILCILFALIVPARAQETAPGDSCATAGMTRDTGGPEQMPRRMLICDGTAWQNALEQDMSGKSLFQVGNDTGACSTDKTGRLRFDATGHEWNYCDGSDWLPFEHAASNGGIGYLVQSYNRWDGNLGGLAGADAKCLSDLQSYDWLGKSAAGTLGAARVSALLCDGTACRQAAADTVYMTAVANSTGRGGMGFLTDAQGRGPGNALYFDDNNFENSYGFWSNRGTVSSTVWSNAPLGGNHCSNWGSTSGQGRVGNMGNNDEARWNESSYSCGSTRYLLCLVAAP
jgi:hypothetical protein